MPALPSPREPSPAALSPHQAADFNSSRLRCLTRHAAPVTAPGEERSARPCKASPSDLSWPGSAELSDNEAWGGSGQRGRAPGWSLPSHIYPRPPKKAQPGVVVRPSALRPASVSPMQSRARKIWQPNRLWKWQRCEPRLQHGPGRSLWEQEGAQVVALGIRGLCPNVGLVPPSPRSRARRHPPHGFLLAPGAPAASAPWHRRAPAPEPPGHVGPRHLGPRFPLATPLRSSPAAPRGARRLGICKERCIRQMWDNLVPPAPPRPQSSHLSLPRGPCSPQPLLSAL